MKRRMNDLALVMVLPLLAQTTLALAQSCEEAVPQLEARYNNKSATCVGANGEPQSAHFCTGLILRGAKRPEAFGGKAEDYYVFKLSPNAEKVGTTATTYARDDIRFADLVIGDGLSETTYTSGMILESAWDTPDPADKVYVACAAPADMWAYDRGDQGCGDNAKTAAVEGRCQDMNITGDNWGPTFYDPNINQTHLMGGTSCAFDMRTENGDESSKAFEEFLKARRYMDSNPKVAVTTYPELRITNPKSGVLPVKAFYYTDAAGREDALKNQAEYKKVTGKDVPVVQIGFPTSTSEKMTFSCDAKPDPVRPTAPASGASDAALAEGGWGTGSDRNQCSSYIKEVSWISREDWRLGLHANSVSVIPTDCGRQIGADQTDAAFAELKKKATALPEGQLKWSNRDGTLRRQFVCHITLVSNGLPVRNKRDWNLEPDRKEVSHEQSLADGCNTPMTDEGVGGGWGPNRSPQCTQYVKSVKWVRRTDFSEYPNETIMSLEITPTECGRNIGPDQTDKFMAEVKRKALAADPQGDKFWGDKDDSMRRQSTCLMKLHRGKPTWNIESKRPNGVSAAQAEAAQCNFK